MSIFKHTLGLVKRLYAFAHPNVLRDWFTLLTISLVALTAIVAWNVWAFDTVSNGGVISVPAPASVPIFNQMSLDVIHGIFNARELEEQHYTSGAYHFTDPSQ